MTICAGDSCYILKARADEPERDPQSRAEMLAEVERRQVVRASLNIAPLNIDAKGWGNTRYELPDGSLCVVDTQPYGSNLGSMVSHEVDGTEVWGEVFCGPRDRHSKGIMNIVAKMHVKPDAFIRPWFVDQERKIS